ncbi:MAG: glutathione S-transferase family protein [Pseudomonadota bacterium]
MLTLYDYLPSGNGYKVRLLLTQLEIPFQRVEMDILAGATRMPDFLAKFPNGRIPAIELDDGQCLSESNAILWYFAEGTRFLPGDSLERAQVLQWMFFEQYSHEPFIAVSRFLRQHKAPSAENDAVIAQKRDGGLAALQIMEDHLKDHSFLVGDHYSIADIALYAYTHVAGDGGFDMVPFNGISAWLERVAAEAKHITIEDEVG